MSNSNGIIAKPIDFIDDIAYVLGSASADSGDLGRMIVNGNINKWAKNKPFRLNKVGEATDSEKATANYGLAAPYATAFGTKDSGFLHDLITGALSWAYQKPRGMSQSPSEWFRAFDFHHYEHSAVNPLPEAAATMPQALAPGTGLANFRMSCATPTTYGLSLGDLKPLGTETDTYLLSNFYPGIAVWKVDNGVYTVHYATGDSKLSAYSIGDEIRIPITGLTAGTWSVHTFLSSIQIAQDTTPSSGYFVGCDDTLRSYVLVETGGEIIADVYVRVLTAADFGTTKVEVTLTNNSGETGTVSNATLVITDGLTSDPYSLTSLNGSYAVLGSKNYQNNSIGIYNRGASFVFTADVSGITGQTSISVSGTIQ